MTELGSLLSDTVTRLFGALATKELIQSAEQGVHAVRAGEHEPLVAVQLQQCIGEWLKGGGWTDFDARNFQHIRAELGKLSG